LMSCYSAAAFTGSSHAQASAGEEVYTV
jgi:hypothetical protein